MTKRRLIFPVVLVFRDRTIDAKGQEILEIPGLFVRRGRVLTIKGVDDSKRFALTVSGPMIVKGDIRIARKPKEISVEDLRKLKNPNAPET